MSIRIVSHCYSTVLPQYVQLLKYQLSSIVLYPPAVKVAVSVCTASDDTETISMTNAFANVLDVKLTVLEKGQLFRRSIGRNIEALRSTEDIVWFTDVDHFFGTGCLDAIYESDWRSRSVMAWTRSIKIAKNHSIGDQMIEYAQDGLFADVNTNDFDDKHYTRAIGGIQICRGDFAREHGYLKDNKKYQTPTDGKKPFPDFRDDVAFRSYVKQYGQMESIKIPNLYRIRHSQTSYK